jgi:hypothetical protein
MGGMPPVFGGVPGMGAGGMPDPNMISGMLNNPMV